jgi:hypothetical protein
MCSRDNIAELEAAKDYANGGGNVCAGATGANVTALIYYRPSVAAPPVLVRGRYLFFRVRRGFASARVGDAHCANSGQSSSTCLQVEQTERDRLSIRARAVAPPMLSFSLPQMGAAFTPGIGRLME